MTKAKAKLPPIPEPLTEYAEDQLRRLREFLVTPIRGLDGTEQVRTQGKMCVSNSMKMGEDSIPAIWLGLEESGHVVIERELHLAYVRPVDG